MQIETDVPSILRILPHKNYQIGEENNDSMNKKFAAISNSNIRRHFKTIFHSKSYNYYLNLQPQFPIFALAIDPVMFGVHQGGKLLIQTRTKTKQSSSRLDKELSPMVDIKHDRVYRL